MGNLHKYVCYVAPFQCMRQLALMKNLESERRSDLWTLISTLHPGTIRCWISWMIILSLGSQNRQFSFATNERKEANITALNLGEATLKSALFSANQIQSDVCFLVRNKRQEFSRAYGCSKSGVSQVPARLEQPVGSALGLVQLSMKIDQ